MSKGLPGSAAWQMAQKICARLIVRNIPMSLLRRKSCSALASTIFESPLHRTKATCTNFFVQSAKRHCREDLLTPESYKVKKCLRHFMKNLRFFFSLRPSGEGLSYMVKKNPACRILRLRRVAPATCSPSAAVR